MEIGNEKHYLCFIKDDGPWCSHQVFNWNHKGPQEEEKIIEELANPEKTLETSSLYHNLYIE